MTVPTQSMESVSLRFDSIRTLRFAVEREATEDTSSSEIAFGLAAEFDWDADERHILVRLRVLFQAEPLPDALTYGAIETETRFVVTGFSRQELEGDQMELPGELAEVVMEEAYATTRGVALTLGRGTLLGRVPLPVRRGAQLTRMLDPKGPHEPT